MDPEILQIPSEFCLVNAIPGKQYNSFNMNQMLADVFGPSFGHNWQDQWLGVLKFMSARVHEIICANPPAPLGSIPVEEVNDPWPKIETVHGCALVGILTDYAIYQYWVQEGIAGTAGAQAWIQYYPQQDRAQDYGCDDEWRGKQWSRIADEVGAGLLYAIACSRGINRWAGKNSETLSDHELDMVLAWIKTKPKLLAYCVALTALMGRMLRGQKPEDSAVGVAHLTQMPCSVYRRP
ncbi:hypothetical protein BDZ91DRAFT_793567 [Kalaharituber pfeilii]|nr:hypothetical protein BDZ91DRAFT_793567 [Kalaharituber pfeilii]